MCEISNICAKYSRPKQCRLNMTTILLAGAGHIVEVTNTCMIQHSTRKQYMMRAKLFKNKSRTKMYTCLTKVSSNDIYWNFRRRECI